MPGFAMVPLRIALAIVFLVHGVGKFTQPGGPGSWAGEELPAALQTLIAMGEVAGAVAMLVGFLTRLAGIGLACIMAGATLLVHWKDGFLHFELTMVLFFVAVAMVIGGSGPVSIDSVIRKRRTAKSAAAPAPTT